MGSTCKKTLWAKVFAPSSNRTPYTCAQKFDFVIKTKVVWSLRDTNRTHRKIYQYLNDDFLIHSEKCICHKWEYLYWFDWRVSPGVKNTWRTSLVVQWLRIHLPMQGTRVWALIQEDPTCCGATKPVCHNYWACALEPMSHNYWAHMPQLLKPTCLEPMLHKKRSQQWETRAPQRRVAPAHCN